MVTNIGPEALRDEGAGPAKLIDVRSPAEFAIGHIPGAINVPMEQVEARTADIGDGPLVIACEAGTRAAIVAAWLEARQPVSVLTGGTAAWRSAGLPLVSCARCRWTLERQVRLAAGLIVLLASLLAVTAGPGWVYLAMFVGAGLTFAGATNICGMAVLLARMPWNRNTRSTALAAGKTTVDCCS
ncbi:MAG TPA: rhodanese-like domain-containing protein [Candidatus Binatia bacterium]|nr:rhodanese-like domain-containing protein [Candidatus Binatia bacterium]